jgi:tetratricopeptide (TPR) repeat protein
MKTLKSTRVALLAGMVLVSGATFGQKKSETDAALAFKSFENAFASQDLVTAKKSILKAKEAIDLAAAHPETQKSPKTLFFKGEIYTSLLLVAMTGDAEFNKNVPADAQEIGIAAYKEAYSISDKFDSDIKNSMNVIRQMLYTTGSAAYDAKKYDVSMETFASASQYATVVGEVDTTAIYYTAISADNLAAQTLDSNMYQKAAEYYKQAASYGFKTENTFKAAGMAYINAGQNDKAIEFLKESINKSPKDKALYFALGTIAMDLKDDQMVIDNLTKATEIDPKYADAYYNLGVYFLTKGDDLRQQAGALTDKKQSDELMAKSSEFWTRSAAALEKYVEYIPYDKEVLKNLYKMYRALKNPEKETKYKALMENASQVISMNTFNKIVEGMDIESVEKLIGFGQLSTEAGNLKTYTWTDGSKIISLTFENNKVKSKSQTGL